MAHAPLGTVLRHLRTLAGAAAPAEDCDGRLLEHFRTCQDEAAFAALLQRHGPMVLAVCRRHLPCEHDAGDAFQATFVVLARKAAAIRRPDSVAGWLHGVAYRIALQARVRAHRAGGAAVLAANDPDLVPLDWRAGAGNVTR
jgi:DNA-directed RNA polymerase specialized sigma24 family protein